MYFSRSMTAVALLLAIPLLVSVSRAGTFDFSERFLAKVRHQYGVPAEARMRRWRQLIAEGLNLPEEERLAIVNDFFNGAQFVDDQTLWHRKDYWATPLEFLARDAGDCEDFSIAKYFTLREMGVNPSKLRITYVKALTLNQAHMVLAYYPTTASVPLILDNLNKRIRPADERHDLKPIYSFNAENLWLSRNRNEQVRAGNPDQLGLWRDLNERMTRDLFLEDP